MVAQGVNGLASRGESGIQSCARCALAAELVALAHHGSGSVWLGSPRNAIHTARLKQSHGRAQKLPVSRWFWDIGLVK